MREKFYGLMLAVTGVLGWLTFGLIIANVDPYIARIWEWLFFYLSLSLALVSTLFLLGWQIRKRFIKRFRLAKHAAIIWRQTGLIVILVVLLLLLQSARLLSWWNILLLVLAFNIIEYFFISYSKEYR